MSRNFLRNFDLKIGVEINITITKNAADTEIGFPTKSILKLYELSENKSPENIIYFDLYFSLYDYFVTSIIVLMSC